MSVYLRRRVSFSAGDSGELSGQPGGHNYICELAVAGTIDEVTGMVVNITVIDAVLKSEVIRPLHGTLLDRDVPEFSTTPPSPVNVARYIWRACAGKLPPECRLAEVKLWWTPLASVSLTATTGGEEGLMVTVTRVYEFSASHRLHAPKLSAEENVELFGKCNRENGHGHNYEVEVSVTGEPNPSSGQLLSIDLLDRIVEEEVLTPFDHRHLNMDIPEFAELNPTSENVTRVIWDRVSRRWPIAGAESVRLHRVAVRETPRNYFEYYGA